MDNQYLKNIKKGMDVEILTSSNKISKGIIEDLASRTEFHEKGIMVRLKNGEIGRVQKILKINKDSTKESNEIEEWINKGESFNFEFKSSSLWSLNYTDNEIRESKSLDLHTFKQKASKVIIARSIAAFLNADGGNLLIGVKEKKGTNEIEIVGVNEDMKKLKNTGKDSSKDGYKRMIIDDIIRPYFPSRIYNHLNNYVIIGFMDSGDKIICNIKIKPSDFRVFIELAGKKTFIIRTETENRVLEAEELVDYCMRRFK
ncbi:Uncharacterised protein [uncultured archaeon]|nr:Uncharacterised protein [uncultured archaeon]